MEVRSDRTPKPKRFPDIISEKCTDNDKTVNSTRMRAWAPLLLLATLLSGGPASVAHAAESADDFLFVRVSAERRELFLQEVFDFTVSVYSQGLNMGREISLHNREAPGLSFFPYRELGGGREIVSGRTFDVRRFLGRAQAVAAGTHGIQPAVRAEIVIPPRGRGARSDGPSPGRAEVRQVDLTPNLLSVDVRPLPAAGRPEGFSGAVGTFAFRAATRPAVVAEGEPVTLTMEIQGRGNIESVAPPRLEAGERFKVYEPKLLKREISEDRHEGRLVFEQVLVPDAVSSDPLPPVIFSYFDPAQRAYRRIAGGPFPLRVTPSAQPGRAASRTPAGAQEPKRVTAGSGILPLKPEPRDWSGLQARSRFASPWFLLLQLAPLGILAALLFGRRRRDERARNPAKARREIAPKTARVGIGEAEEALRQGDPGRFSEAIWKALSSYFCHRLNLLPGEISGDLVTGRLSQEGVDPRVVARLGEIFALSERERFAPPPGTAAHPGAGEERRRAALLAELDRLLQACEKAEP